MRTLPILFACVSLSLSVAAQAVSEADAAASGGNLLADNAPTPAGGAGNALTPSNNITAPTAPLTGSFFSRMVQAYKNDWTSPASDSEPVGHRGFEAPESDPPFP